MGPFSILLIFPHKSVNKGWSEFRNVFMSTVRINKLIYFFCCARFKSTSTKISFNISSDMVLNQTENRMISNKKPLLLDIYIYHMLILMYSGTVAGCMKWIFRTPICNVLIFGGIEGFTKSNLCILRHQKTLNNQLSCENLVVFIAHINCEWPESKVIGSPRKQKHEQNCHPPNETADNEAVEVGKSSYLKWHDIQYETVGFKFKLKYIQKDIRRISISVLYLSKFGQCFSSRSVSQRMNEWLIIRKKIVFSLGKRMIAN